MAELRAERHVLMALIALERQGALAQVRPWRSDFRRSIARALEDYRGVVAIRRPVGPFSWSPLAAEGVEASGPNVERAVPHLRTTAFDIPERLLRRRRSILRASRTGVASLLRWR